ncbi:MarR family transcriptional regulator [Irregularibacter muris]|uniref:HTH-type transcriptional regulator SarZ n=1 Tax=Irregularibacter muris TaxID=1796619 RepID=A0AAE3L348_9FIRM|nr:MarR family transcriptional regulator [Irregularibacter muris]MCR1897633.1 MarR family transcriptional regulator [Irregularibacter muris]
MKVVKFKNEIWDLLRCVNENMESVFRPIGEHYGLTIMQTRILIEINQDEEHTVGTLGNTFGLTSGNASSMCKKLEKMGFLQRIRSEKDERRVKLVLTQLGESTISNIDRELQGKYQPILETKNQDDFEAIIYGLKQLTSILEEMKKLNQ